MSFPNPRTRSKHSFVSSSTSIRPRQSYVSLTIAHSLHTASLLAGKEWLLERDVTAMWLALRLLQVAAVGVVGWSVFGRAMPQWRTWSPKQWGALSSTSTLLFLRQLSLAIALQRMSAIRFIILTQTYSFWLPHLISPTSIFVTFFVGSAFPLSWFLDSLAHDPSQQSLIGTYACVAVYAAASHVLQGEQLSLTLMIGEWPTIAATVLGAATISVQLDLGGLLMGWQSQHPPLPWFALLSTLPLLALTSVYLVPLVTRSINTSLTPNSFPAGRYLLPTVLSTFAPAIIIGKVVFRRGPSLADIAVAALLYVGTIKGASSAGLNVPTRTSTTRMLRTYLKVIMENPDPRKIFYFLMVNLVYMVVQMLWGFWTNSLGLVSDAIHMLFDCFSVGVGLMASIMATWPPNESFTYGYGRIETISGFANGIFLILISIFIMFEAVQRIIDPPEMGNFRQLLIVSSLGLGVNLFGMFAIGGHHHGYSHSHSHGHEPAGHDHSHDGKACADDAHLVSKGPDHSHAEHGHDDHGHGHGDAGHGHSHVDHGHGHSHDGHDEDCDGDHDDHDHHGHFHSHQELHLDTRVNGHNAEGHAHSHSDDSHASGQSTPPDMFSPITPSYHFEHDAHVAAFHPEQAAQKHDDHGHGHNMRGVFLHVMADTLGSVGVIISTLLIELYGWTGFDPIASLFIAVLIAASVIPLVIDCGRVLCLDMGEKAVDVRQALQEILSLEGVSSYSEARFWPKDNSAVVGSIHVRLAPSKSSFDPTGPHSAKQLAYTNVDRVTDRVERLLKSRISGLAELSIQVEGA